MMWFRVFCWLGLICGIAFGTHAHKSHEDNQPITVTITTLRPFLDGPTRTYRVGQQIPVAINLTNRTNELVHSCLSSDLYQDLPQLKRDGQLVSHANWQTYLLQTAAKEQTCQKEGLPDDLVLLPNKPTMVDFLILADNSSEPTGALAWYDQLQPGHYELSVERRFGCCGGPMVESNTVEFDVTP
ncbi:MAG: hypothetical protein C5B55_02560 [Blastocatellia bacterium]|nr:MAG: hypothetical protein C5B55_02560 [Blastocatellia bacterium]